MADGSRVEAARPECRGDPEAALTAEEMIAKSRDLMRYGGLNDPARLIDGVLGLAEGGKPVELGDLFSG